MKQVFIVGNWKSKRLESETTEWFQGFKIQDLGFKNKEVIICPPFTLLPNLKSYIVNHKSAVRLGAQDISIFDQGPYTGEVNGKQIKEFADYVIIGHSERRKYFNETDEVVSQKIEQAVKNQLTPIVCISDIKQVNDKWKMINGKLVIAYEPLFAIGSGTPDTPENADNVAKDIKQILPNADVLYGGSVTSQNVKSFTQIPHINGVLVGGASLDAKEFTRIIEEA